MYLPFSQQQSKAHARVHLPAQEFANLTRWFSTVSGVQAVSSAKGGIMALSKAKDGSVRANLHHYVVCVVFALCSRGIYHHHIHQIHVWWPEMFFLN